MRYVLGFIVVASVLVIGVSNLRVPEASDKPEQISLTSSTIAIRNLESQIATLEELTGRFPEREDYRTKLFDLLSTRMQFLGTYEEDFPRLEAQVVGDVDTAKKALLRARFLILTHEFSDAQQVLEKARELGASDRQVESVRLPLRIARRDNLLQAKSMLVEEAAIDPQHRSLLLAAGIEAELGNFREADLLFEKALSSYIDSSPFVVAYLYFQRGVMWGERAGDSAKAKKYYTLATEYLPEFVTAQVHLAEILFEEGEEEEAIKRLMSVAGASDPEPAGLLGEIFMASGKAELAEKYLAQAHSGYESLLKKYPLAFADHGSEFFSGPGEQPERGFELAKLNLENRENQRAFNLAIASALASENQSSACELAGAAKRLDPTDAPLKELMQSSCGQAGG